MADDRRQTARRMFMEVADLDGPERLVKLASLCGDDVALRAEVEALLRAESGAGEVEPSNQQTNATTHVPPREHAGQMIGRYQLREQIGEGGFGTVWAAEQREPVRRRVALKIIKLGMDSRQVIARFEAERQALALMDHPNIAKVLDAGVTDTGRPYFVMELVKGVGILEYCDKVRLDTRARLDLFGKVCHAIQHAHQKGIIHRDIKPGNVLVSLHDETAVPKVIDFGIAKAMNQELTEKTIFTQHRQMIGTPAYMSPEQAEMSGLDIDTRADIYSLGVLLYELLTGTTPFDSRSLLDAGHAEMMRVIREVEPHRPSARLSSLGDTGSRTAEVRHTDLRKLRLVLKGDLDWIVMKCLEKNRTRRYDTAAGLAADIERHLADQPVTAGPPSAGYKLRKFIRRNRGKVVVGVVVASLLVFGVLGTVTFAAREARQRQIASQRETEARQIAGFQSDILASANMDVMGQAILGAFREQVRVRLERQWVTGEDGVPRPRTDTEIAEALATLDAIAHPSDAAEIAREMIDKGILVPAIESIDEEFAKQPFLQSELLMSIGITYDGIGRSRAAEEVDRRALQLLRENHADSELIAEALYHLANDLILQGRAIEAMPLVREELELYRALHGDKHSDVARAVDQLSRILSRIGEHEEAERLGQEYLALAVELEGEGGQAQINGLWTLAYLAHVRGDLEDAESLYRQALAITQEIGERESRDALTLQHNIAGTMFELGRLEEAEAVHRRVLGARRAMLGNRHPGIAHSLNGLAQTLLAKGDLVGAEPLAVEALTIRREAHSIQDPRFATSLLTMARILVARGDLTGAEPVYRELLTSVQLLHGTDHVYVHDAMLDLCEIWIQLDRDSESESLLAACDESMQRLTPADEWNLARSSSLRGWLLARASRFQEAEPLLLSGYEDMEAELDEDEKRESLKRIIDCYDAWHDQSPDGGYDGKADSWRARLSEL